MSSPPPKPEILVPGVPDLEVERRRAEAPKLPTLTCNRCKCVFTYSREQVIQMGSGNADWEAVACPQPGCTQNVFIPGTLS